ncbi:hypothetical protein HBO23_20570 [Pseudomonas sp. WS 5532]|uniref:hypothetical protein n=1 Tax=Pseudomonas TaxID=286 RepID=UPI000CF63FB3|nr:MULTISPECIES: hypothetical protein [Pseudomonas]AVJ35959.1 hypothetical protein CLM75_00965 [Pseudomonas lurida]NMX75358.1 hypothetical protein [Pseudomonas sp. WS 5532]PRA13540.1 hypothetical protein CQ002_23440 [Pseudomonas sp. MYb13]PRA16876.1 hypothetical protein CQ004_25280 [Pseudomonas lurida]PRA29877.1 hypothetical protein CQ005_23515 [Pseudomonas lurida]
MSADKEFDAITDEVPYLEIYRLRGLQARAKLMLDRRSESEIRVASSTIEWLVNEYFYTQQEAWIRRQIENGGAVLRHLRSEDRTEHGLRELVEERRSGIDPDELDFPSEENTEPLEALEDALKEFDLDDQDFPDAKFYEYVAVLALTLITRAVQTYQGEDWPTVLWVGQPMSRMTVLGNEAVDIMEIVCRAEQLQDSLEVRKRIKFFLLDNEKGIPERIEELAKQKVSLAASLAASARHKETSQSKFKALLCWRSTGSNFSSRAAFARNKHKDYGVTERTLYGWVADHERRKV